ncbi:MAG: FAD-dependent oxidoreductase [Candidatus Lokiarchaeota archaeon]|nr:FAD-dependent oxidoreductase [Candidatus Lokiarchaeota archaeon]
MEKEYDVIIIGAGFGGPVTAKICADAGLKTLMIERSENVGEKVISGLTIPFYGFLFGPDFIRNGNPPFERPTDGIKNYIIKDIDSGDFEIDDSLIIPKPLSPVLAFGYNTYCKPFIEWEVQEALEAGAELRTSTTVVDLIVENKKVKGIITENDEKIRSKIVIDAEGSQGLIAVKAGIREKYPPETISLADIYDYTMPKDLIDKVFGFTERFCWGWDEQKIAPPLGHGNGLMVWPYRDSIHFMQDQCLRLDENIPNLKKLFNLYHKNITSKLPWWKDDVRPHIELRARMWEGFEIFVGLKKKLREFSNHDDGIILIGDAAGLESTELCDGVPAAWFSAEIAAKVAIQAINNNDTSKSFLQKYDDKIKNHDIIMWSITGTNRYNLRIAQKNHDVQLLKKFIHNGWGIGSLKHFTTPFFKYYFKFVKEQPLVLKEWILMSFRYFYNWLHENYGYSSKWKNRYTEKKFGLNHLLFTIFISFISKISSISSFLIKNFYGIFNSIANSLNGIMKSILPIFEPIFLKLSKLIEPTARKISEKLIDFIKDSNPMIYDNNRKMVK